MSEEEIDKIYTKLDVNNDGKISEDEFKVLIKAVLQAMTQE